MNGNTKYKNTVAGIIFILFGFILLLLIVADIVMFAITGEIPLLFEHLTWIAFGTFLGMIMTITAFYFGEPRTDVSPQALRTILRGVNEYRRTKEPNVKLKASSDDNEREI
jgi:hypothetical protein